MAQLLLFPDPRPLVERLGRDFFRLAPQTPGVYLMRDRADTVLYVGKAKNLRRRLASYRVANPERLRRRHLRLLRAVERIELRPCADEAAALENESALLRTLRPAFNRAGTWPGVARYIAWRFGENGLELAVTTGAGPEWASRGPWGAVVLPIRAALARLIWFATHAEEGVAGLPQGWFAGREQVISSIPCFGRENSCGLLLSDFFEGRAEGLRAWIMESTAAWNRAFDLAARDNDLEMIEEFSTRQCQRRRPSSREDTGF
jgi:predicted GIY-YIG superfamily endonuclease